MPIQGSIVLDFGEDVDDSAFVIVELDDQVNLDYNEDIITTFLPGEEVGFIVHFNKRELKIASVDCSSGVVSGGDETSRARSEQVQFLSPKKKVDLSYIPEGDVTFEWYAEDNGNEPLIVTSGREMLPQNATPAIGEASFDISCFAYTLTPPKGLTIGEDESYFVLCVIRLEAAKSSGSPVTVLK